MLSIARWPFNIIQRSKIVGEIKKYKKGEIISREGDFELWMYDLLYGRVGIYADYGTENQVELSINEAPTFFGELGFLDSMPRYGTSVALEDCTVEIINHDNLSEYFDKKPAKIMAIMESLAIRARNIYKQYAMACDTIEEYLELKENGELPTEEIKERMKKYARAAKRIKTKHGSFFGLKK